MARTKDPRRIAEERRRETEAYERFTTGIKAAKTFIEAKMLVAQAPGPDQPGRHLFSNLGFFLSGFTVPAGARRFELNLYSELLAKLDTSGDLREGVLERVQKELAEAPNPP